MVSRAEKMSTRRIPDREGKIAAQFQNAIVIPRKIGVQDQLSVARRVAHILTCSAQFVSETGPPIQTRVGHNPASAVYAGGLAFFYGRPSGLQQRVSEPNGLRNPRNARVRATKRKKRCHGVQQRAVDRRAVALK
jgi:hypothetical protein